MRKIKSFASVMNLDWAISRLGEAARSRRAPSTST